MSAHEPIANFILHRSETPTALGRTFAGTIWGDEFIAGDDVLFEGLCAQTPCKVVEITNLGPLRPGEIRLRWNDPTRQLALYKFSGDPDGIPLFDQRADRYSGPSELVTTVSVSGYFDAIAVAFEQAAGRPPGPSDSAQFELTIQPLP